MYTAELDIDHNTPHDVVVTYANGLGCRVLSKIENGPAGGNPCYTFASDEYNCLKELVEGIFGSDLDNSMLMNIIIPHTDYKAIS